MLILFVLALIFISSFFMSWKYLTFTLYDTKSQLRQMCYTVYRECQRSETLFRLICCCFSWMFITRKHVLSYANHFCCCESSGFLWRCVISFWAWSQNLATECILVGFFKNNIQYTNKAIETCLLKYVVYPKRSFHVVSFWACEDVAQMSGKFICFGKGFLICIYFVKSESVDQYTKWWVLFKTICGKESVLYYG